MYSERTREEGVGREEGSDRPPLVCLQISACQLQFINVREIVAEAARGEWWAALSSFFSL